MTPPLLLLLTLFLSPTASSPLLNTTYYSRSCPQFEQIVQKTTTDKQIKSPTTAAGALRLFFHDCFVGGCDASVLVSSTRFSKAERDADINLSLPGDGFDVVVRAKTEIELSCPGVVSCADILAVATRNLVVMTGGPYYVVKLGRKDSRTSLAADVEGNIPRPTMSMNQLIKIFKSKGFTVQEMAALTGAHTIGFSHCTEFSSILYNYNGTSGSDPAYRPEFAQSLRTACVDYKENPTLSVFNDVMTPGKFDNKYYSNLKEGLGLLSSDHALSSDRRTRDYVKLYSKNQTAFFQAFARAMEKLSVYGVKTAGGGEIRRSGTIHILYHGMKLLRKMLMEPNEGDQVCCSCCCYRKKDNNDKESSVFKAGELLWFILVFAYQIIKWLYLKIRSICASEPNDGYLKLLRSIISGVKELMTVIGEGLHVKPDHDDR